jgi:hypothetical protein
VLGKKTLENEILREALKMAQEKTHLAVALVTRRGCAVRRVVEVLKVRARSSPGGSRAAHLRLSADRRAAEPRAPSGWARAAESQA